EVGNGQSVNEDRAHFSMWCLLAAPLILGNDIRSMTQETKDILTNKEVIDINQDRLGVQGLKFLTEDGLEFWFKPLENDDWAFCILNRTTESKDYTIDWQKFDLYDNVTKRFTNFDSQVYNVRNLWTKKDDGDTKKVRTVIIPGHDVVLYRLSSNKKAKK
ncbi:Alpha-galactosidase A, partial [termite gut metagenome]